MADDDGASDLPEPHEMSRKKLVEETIANRTQIAHDKEHYRKARDLVGEKLRHYYTVNREQEEALHYLEAQLRAANRLLGRDPEHGIDFRSSTGEKKTGPLPIFADDKVPPPVFKAAQFGLI